jgi:DNA mismatch repair protein MutS
MMQQYLNTKAEYPDCILFFRLGDFYEMFFDDAILASKELEITLTGKACGNDEKAPMCGVPYHAVDGYLNTLVSKGYKVAIGEQVEDPKEAKGLVRREVVRVVTPGTNLNAAAFDENRNNYLMSIVYIANRFGIATVDVSTGDFFVTEVDSTSDLIDEIHRLRPSEIVSNEAFLMCGIDIDEMKARLEIIITPLEPWFFDDSLCQGVLLNHFKVSSLQGLGLSEYDIGNISAGSLLQYLIETQKNALSQLNHITPYVIGKYMILDTATRRNLELCETMREGKKRGSLLWVLDKTKTAMGARMLRSFIEQPLINKDEINERYDGVGQLVERAMIREEIREYLRPVYDLERLITKVAYGSANPRDLIALAGSLAMLPHIHTLLKECDAPILLDICTAFDTLEDLHTLITDTIKEEPPILMKEGGIIRDGLNPEVDSFRKAKSEGRDWLAKLEEEERNKTGIKNLKIKFNKVFGYYLEVTNSYKAMVPDYYVRKQTLANAERYTIPTLKELEDTILGAEDKLHALEFQLFTQLRETIGKEVKRIQKTAKDVALIDVLTSLALVAEQGNYVRPKLNNKGIIDIKDGRHPVVEKIIPNQMFIVNDTYLDENKHRISIITGPNMAGKSTYMRQVALITLLAQVGSFVPASSANLAISDRIFTRVGASDDLASGQSTFMVEMTEVANILRNATKKSLLILDEIGRGTSTFDGLSIAWSVIEYISDSKLLGAKTLFATHYHELTELEGKIEHVNNYCIAVKEKGDDIVFLRKIVKGGADKSYGIQVAKLAGVPEIVIDRAKEIVEELADEDISQKISNLSAKELSGKKKGKTVKLDQVDLAQMSLFDTVKDDDVIEELKAIDVSNLTPMDALNMIYQLQNKLKNRW